MTPMGPDHEHQRLIRLTRDSSTTYHEEMPDLVHFVPLMALRVGRHRSAVS
jgi:protein-L-isoaspartate(D-aspartate) O-methyltransferase